MACYRWCTYVECNENQRIFHFPISSAVSSLQLPFNQQPRQLNWFSTHWNCYVSVMNQWSFYHIESVIRRKSIKWITQGLICKCNKNIISILWVSSLDYFPSSDITIVKTIFSTVNWYVLHLLLPFVCDHFIVRSL
jgi:hypothetical protein